MGQPMRIAGEREVRPNVFRFDLDRSITGTAHESYAKAPSGNRPPDVLARRLFKTGTVVHVHVFSNEVEVTFGPSKDAQDLEQARLIIEGLFTYYLPGILPTPIA